MEAADEGRIRQKALAHHVGLHLRPPGLEAEALVHGGDAAVEAHRQGTPGEEAVEGLQADGVLVVVLPDPGMDDEPGDGVAAEEAEEGPELLLFHHAQPGLHRDGHGGLLKDLVEKPLQPGEVRQKPGPLPLGGDGAGGAAQIEVHLPVAHGRQLPGGPEEVFRVFGEELGHQGDGFVLLRQHLPQLPGREDVVLGGREKGGVVPVHPGEKAVVGPAELRAGDPL